VARAAKLGEATRSSFWTALKQIFVSRSAGKEREDEPQRIALRKIGETFVPPL
jgi:hypothetical protein